MNSNTINQGTIADILKSDSLDEHTEQVLGQAKAHPEFIDGLNIDIYNLDTSFSMRQIIEYRISTLEKSGRPFYGAAECALKLKN